MTSIYQTRRANLATWMAQNGIGMVLIDDSESKRDPALRYFSGHPSDALLGICVDGTAILCPWDENLAANKACVDGIIPYTQFDRSPIQAAYAITKAAQVPKGSRIEIPSATPYPQFLRYVDTFTKFDVLCRENGAHRHIARLRAVKDEAEIAAIRRAASITDSLIDKIESGVRDGSLKTEADVALLIEKQAHCDGCEGTGFGTLAAGPSRSYGIHCFPSFTDGAFAETGLSILDFGLIYDGYTSDVTLTVAKGELSGEQELMISLVEEAYNAALPYYKVGVDAGEPCRVADEVFAKHKKFMPHALGHGIGLEAHESPSIRSKSNGDWTLAEGMVITLEPGLYDAKHGGCRLENDVLITKSGNEVLTHSRIIRV